MKPRFFLVCSQKIHDLQTEWDAKLGKTVDVHVFIYHFRADYKNSENKAWAGMEPFLEFKVWSKRDDDFEVGKVYEFPVTAKT